MGRLDFWGLKMSDKIEVGQIERKTQDRIVDLFCKDLGYEYLGNWEKREGNSNIEREYLIKFLKNKQGYPDNLIKRAIDKLERSQKCGEKSLYARNKEMYELLRYGAGIKEVGESTSRINFINWKEPLENDFYVAEEVSITGENNKRPDVVLYVNGIALGVIELKRSKISVSEGIRQSRDNQQGIFIRDFFTTIQLVMAGNDSEGLRYGCIETKEKYYLKWKEDSNKNNLLDKNIERMCSKERLLELIYDFIVFDLGTKKICRHNQYFGVKKAQVSLGKKEGGVIWHTQGSGKSLTMVWLAKWIKENIDDSRILIITDRTELDDQIETVFIKAGETGIYRTKNGRDLLSKLNKKDKSIICSLVHKFKNKNDDSIDDVIKELKSQLPKDFSPKGNIYVFVDECHRTQSGKLHDAMKDILPNSIFIGFTGTPLLKKDKKKSLEVFGKYIDTYKFDEAVTDGVILDLCYEARDVDQRIGSQEKIDKWFELKTQGLNDFTKIKLKKKWGTMQKVLSSKQRLDNVVSDILMDFEEKNRLMTGRGNAMLVANGIGEACKYYKLFQDSGFEKCAIVTSYDANISSIKGEDSGEDEKTENIMKYDVYKKMLNGMSPEDFEKEVKKKFVEEPAQMKLLIVVDKLLTGFDAPHATYLYVDKSMKDHGLFQAICRVNRLDGEDKDYGYIIDYKNLMKKARGAIKDYTSGEMDGYDEKDIEGLLNDRLTKNREDLDNSLESVKALCEGVLPPKGETEYIHYFCGKDKTQEELKENEPKRVELYKIAAKLIRSFSNIANEFKEAGYSQNNFEKIRADVKYYSDIREIIQLASGESVDLKRYEGSMRRLIDSYIIADDSKKISNFEDTTLLELILKEGSKEAIKSLPKTIVEDESTTSEIVEGNMSKTIIDKNAINPKYYEKMSRLLLELIRKRREGAIKYQKYLDEISKLAAKIEDPSLGGTYPKKINNNAKRALYDYLDENEESSLLLDKTILENKKDSWRGNIAKERKIKKAIYDILQNEERTEEVFEIVRNQLEY